MTDRYQKKTANIWHETDALLVECVTMLAKVRKDPRVTKTQVLHLAVQQLHDYLKDYLPPKSRKPRPKRKTL